MSVFRNIENEFQLPKGWAFPENTRFGKKSKQIDDQKDARKLIRFAHSEEIKEDHVPKVDTIQNWIGQYSRKFNQRGTVIELETFLATGSSPNGN
ncbi:3767_t:CDS:2 [Gigaspora margarita]|uniref:3767_t:CDS:1 n=1 Tax=Gigaspora margarita TaxID=4874 RepID=A0ABN7UFZ2_GIGMA|nr:3767_t:CDS:2 [Gigaspora margarita]